ncbi:MAG: ORC1-type DNA replication protein [Candidatus Hodarchaeales archaeon]|jgi:cell division control protein 6
METDPLDQIFDEYLESPTLFKQREALSAAFIPPRLPHRTEEIKTVGSTLAVTLKGATPSNIFVYGKPGTGKTAVVRHVLSHLKKRAEDRGIPFASAYVNCQIVDTNYRVLATLCASLGVQVPFTGLPADEVHTRFCKALDRSATIFVIVLDEVDALVKKSGEQTLYNLTRINTTLKNARVSLIGVSNDLKFREYLAPRVLSSLSEQKISFFPYKAPEIINILQDRAELAFHHNALASGAIPLIAALAASEHGDARRAIDLLRAAGEIAEKEQARPVTETHVKDAQNLIERNTTTEVITNLPLQSRLVLGAIFLLETGEKRTNHTTGEVYERYYTLCKELGLEHLTQRRVSDLINELDVLGVVNARVISKGRYGRTKRIRIAISITQIKTILVSDRFLGELID